jgi:DNA-binding NtrC family response regulator
MRPPIAGMPTSKERSVRKRRAIIFDDEDVVLSMLEDVFQMRGYEVIGFKQTTSSCPMQDRDTGACGTVPCADVMLSDFHMPGLNGLELLRRQSARGCPLDIRNKGVISGNIDGESLRQITAMGCVFFQKPFALQALMSWIDQCEMRSDLYQPLVTRRGEERIDSRGEAAVRLPGSNEVLKAAAVNVSASGICVEVPAPLKSGEILNVIKAPRLTASAQATVRWVRKHNNGSYLAGLIYF